MSSQSFYASSTRSKRTQAAPRRRVKATLSKEARALLTASHRQKSNQFKAALDDAWANIDDSIKSIATANGKSTADNENGLSGKAVLQDIVQENRAEYHELDDDTKARIMKEYEEYRATKSTGIRISTKSKVNDVTQTLKAIKNELKIMNRRGNDTGVDNFMGSVMNLDNQDIVGKMEGFAMNGICGSVPQSEILLMRNFNLSKVSSSLTSLEMLEWKWKSGEVDWRQLEEEEFKKLHCERNEKLNSGEIVEHCRRTRSDKGKKRTCARSPDENDENMPPRRRKKTYKSVPAVDTDTDNNNNDNNNGSSNTPPAPSPSASMGRSDQIEPSVSNNNSSSMSPAPPPSASAGHSDQIRPPESTPVSGGAPPPSLNNILDPALFKEELSADSGLTFFEVACLAVATANRPSLHIVG
ncbi:hypothetical protein P692DRAFT_20816590 [Suillus brevipes Sb2]|nr:hypothetical protein P692DRAFT_20816590 [Suillus brevipes Sb2]